MHVNENWCLGVEDGKSTHQIRVHITNLFYDTIKKDLSYYMQLIKEFFFRDKVKKYFTYNIYRNSSNMGRKILIIFLFKKKKGINTMYSTLYTKQTIFSHFYTQNKKILSKQRLLITQRQFTS